eukprot:TRINITY_DN768_c3_g1_i2.p1 TRINITY_DN768_c3_g1~~TRINITY_DN768_c3_g1_i2.p1  ORF type:complete len:241 (-),score=53.03 TRINITY_DN768_c3_g1_i2:116-838(-)
MATPEDLRVNSEYIRLADQFVEVPGGSNVNNYANVALIVTIAQLADVQAVWAGWGHASENPKLPAALAAAGIAFIGPPAGPMRDLGDKICSTILAQSAGVSCVPWSGDSLTVKYNTKDGEGDVSEEILAKACVSTLEEAQACLKRIGFPSMIKASEGGGGKGIREVRDMEHLGEAFRHVRSEVPNSPIFIMKKVENAHHLEVQIIADEYGNAIALNGRDCSVQRRHQKNIRRRPTDYCTS